MHAVRSTLRQVLAGVLFLPLICWAQVLWAEEAAASAERAAWRAKVDPWVLESVSRFGTTDFLAFLTQQADLSAIAGLPTKQQKGRLVFEKLTSTAERTQRELLELLAERGVEHRSFWIANMIWVHGDLETVQALAIRPEVERLAANPSVPLELPAATPQNQAATAGANADGIGPSIVHTGAPAEFWANGFEGQGVVIGGGDTGYDWRHPALISSYRGWDGETADHNYNWHDAIHSGGGSCGADSPEPCDDDRHGTHTMGTMVGDDGAGDRIGMAPKARWIGCRNMDQNVGTPATYSECFEWFIAPTDLAGDNPDPAKAPDVINNSWSCPESEGCTDPNVLRTVVENTRAAGILVVASAGNRGPSCWTVDTPIAIYDAALTVGATDNDDEIAGFSSRGSVRVDGSERTKPDLVAPGVGVRSSTPGSSYDSFNGTSMAGPHVAGMAALVLSAADCKRGRPSKLERHILKSVLPRPAAWCLESSPESVPNLTYGYGALRAVLPTCRLDGRVAALTSRVQTQKAVCRNKTSGKRAEVTLNGVNMWNCMARGLTASAGDRVWLKVTGTARQLGTTGGQVTGLKSAQAICRNLTTGAKVRIPGVGSKRWSCEQAGLVVNSGDRLKVTILGRAAVDSQQNRGQEGSVQRDG